MVSSSTVSALPPFWQDRLPGISAMHKIFGHGVLNRGRKYLRKGRVSSLYYTENEIRAEVRGTELYNTRLVWRGRSLDYLCSCPYGLCCKHAAALVLKAHQEAEAAPAAALVEPAPEPAIPRTPAGKPDLPYLFHMLKPPAAAPARRRLWVVLCPDFKNQRFELRFLMDSPRLRKSPRDLYELMKYSPNGSWRNPGAVPEWSPQDWAMLRMLAQLPTWGYYQFQAKTVDAEGLATFLLGSLDFPRLLLGAFDPLEYGEDLEALTPLTVSLKPLRVEFDGAWKRGAAVLQPRFYRPDGSEVEAKGLQAVDASRRWWFDGRAFFLDDSSFHPQLVAEAGRGRKFRLEPPAALLLEEQERGRFSSALAAAWPVVETLPLEPVFYLDWEASEDRLLLRALLRHAELGLDWNVAGSDESPFLPHPQDAGRWLRCDPQVRAQLLDRVTEAGFRAAGNGRFALEGFDQAAEFLFTRLPEWREWGEVYTTDAVRRLLEGGHPIQPRISITSSGLDWFELDVRFFDEEEELDTSAVWEAIRAGRRYARLRGPRGERVVILDTEAMPRLRRELEELGDPANQRYRCSPFLLSAAVEGLETLARVELAPEARAFYERLRAFHGIRAVEPPAELAPVLRSYQKEGLAYLHYLEQMNFGGALADDMGLGKTLQALAYLENLRHARGTAPNLVVCPTSVGHNWIAEAARFTPQMKTLLLERGPARHSHYARLEQYDLVVTSYALLRRDLERLKGIHFRTLILDEAQNIKNPATRSAACAREIQAERRLALTGTPLENSVLDLWSIYDVLLPGLLGTLPQFQARYQAPIEKENIAEVRARLARRLRPFLLRRRKVEVAPELPPRVEQTVECDLTPAQRRLYREVAEQARGEVMQAVRERGLAQSHIHILAALLRLRQICCHPMLLAGRLDGRLLGLSEDKISGKMNAFVELLDSLLAGGHRVLVFSQFVQMLSLLRRHLQDRAIPHAYLDGSTVRRHEEIERFQTDPHCPVFLLSLKAGGTGLNLTAADYVILYDPWWNPAVENQAIDRTHRIGQTQTVMAYRMVTRGTVEEKILQLQARKAELVRAVVESDTAFAKRLTMADLEELFRAQ